MSHKECAQGHVIEDAETVCSRCNGAPINQEVGDSAVEEQEIETTAPVEETPTEEVAPVVEPESTPEAPVAPVEEVSAPVEEVAPEVTEEAPVSTPEAPTEEVKVEEPTPEEASTPTE